MAFYTRRQLAVLLILLAIAGVGLAVGHWRRARPDLADYLEQLDRAPAPVANPAAPRSESSPPTAPSSEPEPRRSRRSKSTSDAPRSPGAPAGVPSDTIDLNRATPDELTRLPGIGPALARRIVDARTTDGLFTDVDELGRVRGMSVRKVEKLRVFLTITR